MNKETKLVSLAFFISLFNSQHVSDVNTSILRSLRLICWVISWVVLLWFDVCRCYGVVRLGWCGVVYGCKLKYLVSSRTGVRVSVYIPFVKLKPLLWSHFYRYLNGNSAKRHWRTGKEPVLRSYEHSIQLSASINDKKILDLLAEKNVAAQG